MSCACLSASPRATSSAHAGRQIRLGTPSAASSSRWAAGHEGSGLQTTKGRESQEGVAAGEEPHWLSLLVADHPYGHLSVSELRISFKTSIPSHLVHRQAIEDITTADAEKDMCLQLLLEYELDKVSVDLAGIWYKRSCTHMAQYLNLYVQLQLRTPSDYALTSEPGLVPLKQREEMMQHLHHR